jgi:dipeptidyl aminopeptidase/acylaminoacyl peptidase
MLVLLLNPFSMKISLIITLLAIAFLQAFAQKSAIDTSVYGKWPSLGGKMYLSNNGRYVVYGITNPPLKGYTTVVKATIGNWKKEFINIDNSRFSEDSKLFIYKHGKDSLCLLAMETGELKYITHVQKWPILMEDNSPWLVYQLDTPKNEIIVYNITTGRQQSFDHIIGCQIISGGSAILLQQQKSDNQISVQWANLFKGDTKVIWQGEIFGDIAFNTDSTKLVLCGRNDSKAKKQLWLYKKGEPKAIELNFDSLDVEQLSNFKFDGTGTKLFFSIIRPTNKPKPNTALASVDIYSYKDTKLQSEQLQERQNNAFTCVYNLHTKQMVRLNGADEEIKSVLDGNWILIKKGYGGDEWNEWNWNKNALVSIFAVSTIDGSRKCIAKGITPLVADTYSLSPSGKYVIYYDTKVKDYFSYNIISGKVKDMTQGIKISWVSDYSEDRPIPYERMAGIFGWIPNDQAVWLKSRYDIFRADPEGKLPLINLTNGYGLKHHLTFISYLDAYSPYARTIDPVKPMLMHFTNEDNKDEGFCRVSLTRQKNPEFLSVFPKRFYGLQAKSRDADIYAVDVYDERSAPNYYVTRDFKTFAQLTDLQPQKVYNWLTAELVKWKTTDGNVTQGILYKPKNFDPKRKYPIIFHYYERMSGGLHNFPDPQYQDGSTIDIATYVSNGYLVFLPDVHFKIGHPGQSSLNTLLSAVKHLSKYPWVDQKHMGLMGHSFGAFETNYVITHSHLFAAAVSMSGMSNSISGYDELRGSGESRQTQYETGQSRIGATLWQRPDLYFENSPIFGADKVTTPVLLMANKKDESVPYEQGFEFFTALRRLGKKAWMLQYDNGGHQVESETDKKDLTIRTRQFFDYYLMGKTPPKWMTDGIPASQKQIDSGYEPSMVNTLK